MIDVLVAGAGPVGLATAMYAAKAGMRVAVIEPRSTPIDKACGEGLMPAAVMALRELGVDPAGREFRGIRYTDGRRQAEATFRDQAGLGVRRTELQAAMAARVADLGVPIVHGRVASITQDEASVRAAGMTARYLVAADGLHSPIRRQLRLEVLPRRPRPARFGLRQHFSVRPWTDLVEVHWSGHSEAYVTPLAADLVGIAILTSSKAPFAAQLQRFPVLAGRVSDCRSSSVRGAGPLWQRARRRVAGRVLLVGDAAGYVDALTGEGINVGLAAARELVGCLARNAPREYDQAWNKASRRYRTITESLLWTARNPLLRRMIVPAAAACPPAFGAVVRQLA